MSMRWVTNTFAWIVTPLRCSQRRTHTTHVFVTGEARPDAPRTSLRRAKPRGSPGFAFQQITALTLSIALLTSPLAYAQTEGDASASAETPAVEASASEPVVDTPAVDESPASEETPVPDEQLAPEPETTPEEQSTEPEPAPEADTVDPQAADVPVQDTYNEQDAVASDALEDTIDPADVAGEQSGDQLVPVDDATTTEETALEIPADEDVAAFDDAVVIEDTKGDVVAEAIDESAPEEPQPEYVAQPVVNPPVPEASPVEVAAAELEPQPDYAFALTGKHIRTKKMIDRDNNGIPEKVEEVTQALTPTVDNEKGIVTVAGQCSDVYYVVLLFRNEDDYARDPRSYIVNRAYPCENGSFSYDIDKLPSTLPDGTYYLLIGSQGERGAWKPITSLTEISINHTPSQ